MTKCRMTHNNTQDIVLGSLKWRTYILWPISCLLGYSDIAITITVHHHDIFLHI